LSENVRRGNRTKVENGWWPNLAPLGYLNDPSTKTVVKDPERFPLVRKMWDCMLTGAYSPRTIFTMARFEWGFRTPQRRRSGGKPLALSAIYKILTNPFYAGILPWGGETYPGKHEPMITLDEFERVQQLLGRPGRARPRYRVFAYTGMIRCGECGLSVTAEEKINRYGYHYTYYHCTKKRWDVRCSQPCIELKELERQVLSFLSEISISEKLHQWALRQLDGKREGDRDELISRQRALEKAHDDTARSLDNLTKLRIRDLITDQEFTTQRGALQREQLHLRQSLDRLKDTRSWLEPSRMFVSFSSRATSWFQGGDIEVKRLILEIVGSNLALTDKKLCLEAKKPFRRWAKTASRPELLAAVEDVRTLMENPSFLQTVSGMRRLFEKMEKNSVPRAA
jgi:hypothetical protein